MTRQPARAPGVVLEITVPDAAESGTRATFQLRPLDSTRAPITVFTNRKGVAQARLRPGRYQLRTVKPVEINRELYTWNLEVPITQSVNSIELSYLNADSIEVVDSVARNSNVDAGDRVLRLQIADLPGAAAGGVFEISPALEPSHSMSVVIGPEHRAEVRLRPGRYVVTGNAVGIGNVRYTWNVEVPVTDPITDVAFTAQNSLLSDTPTAVQTTVPTSSPTAIESRAASATLGSAPVVTSEGTTTRTTVNTGEEAPTHSATVRATQPDSAAVASPRSKPETQEQARVLRDTDLPTPSRQSVIDAAAVAEADELRAGRRNTVKMSNTRPVTANTPRNDTDARGPAPQITHELPPVDSAMPEPALRLLLARWVESVKNHDLQGVISCYAPQLSIYFRKRNVPLRDVKRDKEAFLRTYSEIRKLDINDIQFELNDNGIEATLHKTWDFAGARTFSGEVVARLTFTKIDGRWLISGERERLVWAKKSAGPLTVAAPLRDKVDAHGAVVSARSH